MKKEFGRAVSFVFLWAALFSVQAAGAPSLKSLYTPLVQKIASQHGVPADLIHAIIRAESNYESGAVSSKGAIGLMQLMPETAKQYGVENIYDPAENIEGGTKYLKDLIKLYRGERDLVLAAYNAGQEAVKKYKGIPPYPETRGYIKRVQASYGQAIIRTRTVIYKFKDREGRLILTNDLNIYLMHKAN